MKKEIAHTRLELEELFVQHVSKEKFWKPTDRLFIACSGGLDSVALVHLLHAAGQTATLLHCNFQLRGEESNRDEAFVRSLAEHIKWPFRSIQFNTEEEVLRTGKGIQEVARDLRYAWFNHMLDDAGGSDAFVLTAHQANDVAETLVFNFFRGTGIKGLHGIPARSGRVLRPLLPFKREAIHAYAKAKPFTWVDDSSNLSSDYTRNLIRNELLPLVEEAFPHAVDTLVNTAKHLEETESIFRAHIHQQLNRLKKVKASETSFAVNALALLQPLDTFLYEAFVPFGFSSRQTHEIKKLLEAPSGKFMRSATHRILKDRNWLRVHPLHEEEQSFIVVDHLPFELRTASFNLLIEPIELTPNSLDKKPHQEIVSADHVELPLLVRQWKPGDYLYPLGMSKKKKVARLLTDLKLSLNEKEQQRIIESGKKIVCVLGRRIDDRFKLNASTRSALRISFTVHSE